MRFAFLRFFLSFLGVFVFVFVFVVVYISYVCHTCHNADCIKNRKIMGCKKTSSQFCVLVWYAMRGFEQTLYLVRGYNPSVFSACKTSRKSSSPSTGGAENRAPMAQRAPLPYRAPQPRVISPSVVLLKSRTQSDSSLLRGSRGGCRRAPQNLPQREPSGCRRFRRGAQIPAPCTELPRYITPQSEFRILTAPSIFCPLGKKQLHLHRGAENTRQNSGAQTKKIPCSK